MSRRSNRLTIRICLENYSLKTEILIIKWVARRNIILLTSAMRSKAGYKVAFSECCAITSKMDGRFWVVVVKWAACAIVHIFCSFQYHFWVYSV